MSLTKDIRYKVFPQLIEYDQMGSGIYTPYAMLSGPISYKSKIVNTDKFGFRETIFNNKKFLVSDIKNYDEVNLLVGWIDFFWSRFF